VTGGPTISLSPGILNVWVLAVLVTHREMEEHAPHLLPNAVNFIRNVHSHGKMKYNAKEGLLPPFYQRLSR
jgi:hypothetical protein